MHIRKTGVVSLVLAAIFALSGGAKLAGAPLFVELFQGWGYPLTLMTAIGLFEIIGAIGLLVPRIASVAAVALALLMVAAIYTHLFRGAPLLAFVPLGLGIALLHVAKRRLSTRQSWVLPMATVARTETSPIRKRAGHRAH